MWGGDLNRPLTAEDFARAIIAAAGALGDDPVRAMLAKGGPARRCLAPAIWGLARSSGLPAERLAHVMRIQTRNIGRPRTVGGPGFERAEAAAEAAVSGQAEPRCAISPPQPEPPAARSHRPELSAAFKPQRVLTAKAVREAIRDALHTDNATAPELASALNLSEAQVRQGVRELAELGEARADPLTAEGWRVQTWRWVPK